MSVQLSEGEVGAKETNTELEHDKFHLSMSQALLFFQSFLCQSVRNYSVCWCGNV